MTLREYLQDARISQAQFARAIGVSRQSIVRYLGGRIPDPKVVEAIALATGCKVTANDFHGIATAERIAA
jgi:transcriptional regulator with XRE-family HTH domain